MPTPLLIYPTNIYPTNNYPTNIYPTNNYPTYWSTPINQALLDALRPFPFNFALASLIADSIPSGGDCVIRDESQGPGLGPGQGSGSGLAPMAVEGEAEVGMRIGTEKGVDSAAASGGDNQKNAIDSNGSSQKHSNNPDKARLIKYKTQLEQLGFRADRIGPMVVGVGMGISSDATARILHELKTANLIITTEDLRETKIVNIIKGESVLLFVFCGTVLLTDIHSFRTTETSSPPSFNCIVLI